MRTIVHPDVILMTLAGQINLFQKPPKITEFNLRQKLPAGSYSSLLLVIRISNKSVRAALTIFHFTFVYFQDCPRGLIILYDVSQRLKKSPLALFNLFQFWLSAI